MLNKYSFKGPLCLVICFLTTMCCVAAPRYWVGPINGKWSDAANWSETSGGPGGAGMPSENDDVLFFTNNSVSVIDMDVSTTINSLQTRYGFNASITFYAVGNVTLTIDSSLLIRVRNTVTDSTFGDVSFNVVLKGSSQTTGEVSGDWTFKGGSEITGGNGPGLTIEEGSRLNFNGLVQLGSGSLILRNNHGLITSNASTLQFEARTKLVIADVLNAAIPSANWDDSSSITISGNMSSVTHLGRPTYGTMVVDLPALSADVSLSLPNGAQLSTLTIANTNNHTLTIFDGRSSANANISFNTFGGLNISGSTTRVALARADQFSSAADFQLTTQLYNQTGGNFSLQESDEYTGSSTLAVLFNVYQTGGTFITNSKAQNPTTKFVLQMILAQLRGNTSWEIGMGSGTIDNGRNMVTLRLSSSRDEAILALTKPLKVGKLEVIRGTLKSTNQNILTITNPDSSAVNLGTGPGVGLIDGPLRRATNSTSAYEFPPGNYLRGLPSCWIIPTSSTNSMYQVSHVYANYPQSGVTFPLKGISNREYWDISKVEGADAKVRLSLNGAVTGASSSDAIVVAHFVNGSWISERGTTIVPGTVASGSVTSKLLTNFGPFTFGYEDVTQDTITSFSCPNDTIILSALLKTKVVWRTPNGKFPETLGLMGRDHASAAKLIFKGIFADHGYYMSNEQYHWSDANNALSGSNGHLVTINSIAENTFINTYINERENYAWIGLKNTGMPGRFAWVTGEPLDYTNWIPGQPDNLYGMDNADTSIFEPYVHINGFDSLNRWNDNGWNANARMLAEFEHPILNYRQISGPVNGDSLSAGTYTVCYEKTNTATGIIDTCCFNITVISQPTFSSVDATKHINTAQGSQNIFSAQAISNPSTTSFMIKINGNNATEKITVEVSDAIGRIVERKSNVMIGNTLQLGTDYTPGIYFARISQGKKFTVLKLVKK